MKAISLKNLCATTSLLAILGAMSSAQADVFGGFLGAAASATDVYGMTCPLGTTSVRANVNDGGIAANGIFVSVQIVDPQGGALNATAPDFGGPSPTVIGVGPGPGNYLALVNKGQAGGEGYVVFLDCFIGAVAVAGNQSALVQNQ
ncbi:MAG: hypothetical protein ACT4QB_21775 [Gammaproteobacteria bacterium]